MTDPNPTTNPTSDQAPNYDRGIMPSEVAARMEREGDQFRKAPDREGAVDTTTGYTVDREGLLNNYAIEPEMYIEEPGDLREQNIQRQFERAQELQEIRRVDGEGELTEERDTKRRGPGLI